MNKFELLRKINIIQFIYLNKICKKVEHKGNGRIIPYKNSIVDISAGGKIVMYDEDLEIGFGKLKKSKAETLLRIHDGAIWNVYKTCTINYGCTLEVLRNAKLQTDYFTMNSNSVLVCAEDIRVQNDVMIGRNVIIYDSDYHKIEHEQYLNPAQPVIIGNHVWIGTNSMILKGTHIGDNCIIGAGERIKGEITADNTVINGQCFPNKGLWKR